MEGRKVVVEKLEEFFARPNILRLVWSRQQIQRVLNKLKGKTSSSTISNNKLQVQAWR
jgi:hypothetical protein